ncbi:ribose 5-phosphate isomerase B [Thermospira aquatica]|uniref:Ribose 5-phosphate isomerase B n=1 Tax=Thermospira aquatica TaxID=2828656 RepID=A0AAX3BAK4_9SPIR|nr:ribose 5-phosphate isomerase B [Thermospira aquatica]URA09291.1 ribose 5-phosphate isomerase B [Thermospira aquatica]
MKIAMASDHAAYQLKEHIKIYLQKKGYDVVDFGTHSEESMDYPDTIKLAARAVARKDAEYGIVLCGSGIGASIVANKIRGIRAALCLDAYSAEYSRRHNDANVMVLGGRRTPPDEAEKLVDIWLSTAFEGGRHVRRVEKIHQIEDEECHD